MMQKKTTKDVSRRLRHFAQAKEAVSALEYAILVGVIAVAIVAALGVFGGKLTTAVTNLGNNIISTTSSVGTP